MMVARMSCWLACLADPTDPTQSMDNLNNCGCRVGFPSKHERVTYDASRLTFFLTLDPERSMFASDSLRAAFVVGTGWNRGKDWWAGILHAVKGGQ